MFEMRDSARTPHSFVSTYEPRAMSASAALLRATLAPSAGARNGVR
jgi:hypothetical protein